MHQHLTPAWRDIVAATTFASLMAAGCKTAPGAAAPAAGTGAPAALTATAVPGSGQTAPDGGAQARAAKAPLPDIGVVPPPVPGTEPAEANLRVAIIGDTASKTNFEKVLGVIKGERAAFVLHVGDAVYDGEKPPQFWGVVDRLLGHGYPYFFAQGNHDRSQWSDFGPHALEHARVPGAAVSSGDLVAEPRYHAVYRGISMTMLGEKVRPDDPTRIVDRFKDDKHIWKVCAWHKNQKAMQVGGKGDEMGWGVYEACRQMGALVMTGHEHSYERTKTLIDTREQIVDPACPDPQRVCVRPGAVPVFVSGLGGRSIRDQKRCLPETPPYGCKGEWAFVYTSNQGAKDGALFVDFGVGGNARKARGYFKNVDGLVVDDFVIEAR